MKAIKVVNDPESFQLLADDTRRRIVFLLRAKEMTVSRIADALEVTPQTIYHHIKKLQKADLVQVVKEERVGHLIESYYRATAEAFICSVGATPEGREFYEKQMKGTLDALVRIGFELKYDEEDTQNLIELQDRLNKCCSEKDFEEDIDSLKEIDNVTLSVIKEYGKLLLMTDEEFEEQQRLKKEFRESLKSLMKN
ncbi:MAG: helix-turn-helix domain-containing protein [Candidatus Bathyarchaeota archaeon]|jgi:DNA-binding transcriptional ArsR family regulator